MIASPRYGLVVGLVAASSAAGCGFVDAPTARGQGNDRRTHADPSPVVGIDVTAPRATQALREAPIRKLQLVGRHGVAFRAFLDGPVDGTLIPRTRRRPRAPERIVAAARLGRALHMDHVAPAVLRSVPRDALRRRLAPADRASWDTVRQALPGPTVEAVDAALVCWQPHVRSIHVRQRRRFERWLAWLTPAQAPPRSKRRLASDLATGIFFDYLVARPDRLADHRLSIVPSGRRLPWMHHPAVLEAPRVPPVLRRRLERVQRFPREFVRRLAELSPARMEPLWAREGHEGELLRASRRRQLRRRRGTLMSYIGSVLDAHGRRLLFDTR